MIDEEKPIKLGPSLVHRLKEVKVMVIGDVILDRYVLGKTER